MRTLRDQVGVKNGMDLVLDPGPMPHDLAAPRNQPAHPLGFRHPASRSLAGSLLGGPEVEPVVRREALTAVEIQLKADICQDGHAIDGRREIRFDVVEILWPNRN